MQDKAVKDNSKERCIHFASRGKLRSIKEQEKLQGLQWIMDEDNLTDIIGEFKQGYCKDADVYCMKDYRLRKVRVKIQNNEIWIGGDMVEEQSRETMFIGGYLGYKRYGYGTVFDKYEGKDYEEWGFWNGAKIKGNLVRQHQSLYSQDFAIISYQDDKKLSEICYKKTKKKIQKVWQNEEGEQQCESIHQDQFTKQFNNIDKWRQQLHKERQQNTNSFGKINDYPLHCQHFYNAGLSPHNKLSHDQCGLYIQYLFHQLSNHQSNRNAVVWHYAINCYLQSQKEPKYILQYKKELIKQMRKFSGKFSLFGGLWDQIIIPLIFPSINHYCFVVYNLKYNICVVYDSILNLNRPFQYESYIKKFLIDEAQKTPSFNTRPLQELKVVICQQFPIQQDDYSCGYYMLWGIFQLMESGKITFTNSSLGLIKLNIITKLNELNDWMELVSQ